MEEDLPPFPPASFFLLSQDRDSSGHTPLDRKKLVQRSDLLKPVSHVFMTGMLLLDK